MAHKLGFSDLDPVIKKELYELNPTLEPLMMRYQGMGWYDILVQHKKGYTILSMGGENGYTAKNNEKQYMAVDDQHEFMSLDNLFESIKEESWQEIVSQETFSYGIRQKVREMREDPLREDPESSFDFKIS